MSRPRTAAAAASALMGVLLIPGHALGHEHPAHPAHPTAAPPAISAHVHDEHAHHRVPPAAGVDQAATGHVAMGHAAMGHAAMDHGSDGPPPAPTGLMPATPIPAVTAGDRAAAFPVLAQPMQHAPQINHHLVLDQLEIWDAKPGTGQAWDAMAWVGSDLNRLWVRSAGERSGGATGSAHVELLYGRSLTPWWDVVTGVRHDFLPGAARDWAVLGMQGVAPYKFEVEASAYLASSGHSSAALKVEYELLFSSRLILQPEVEIQLFGKDDPASGHGAGLATAEAALRLRYEIHRRFAPYVGVVHEQAYGRTASLREAGGEAIRDTRIVVGVRLW